MKKSLESTLLKGANMKEIVFLDDDTLPPEEQEELYHGTTEE